MVPAPTAPAADPQPFAARARDPSLTAAERIEALRDLARTTGIAATPIAGACLRDESAQLRLGAAEILGSLGGREARQTLELQLAVETNPEVREALQKSLARSQP
jgi:hypothetical protein